jgi:hypothetical protein
MVTVSFVFGKSVGANMTNPNDQKLNGRLLKIRELKTTRWPVKRNPFEGKPKQIEWIRPVTARMTAGSTRAPAKQQASPRTPAGTTTGNSDGGLSEDSETEEEEWSAPNEGEQQLMAKKAESEEHKMLKQEPARPTGLKGRPFKGMAKDVKARMRVPDPEWLKKNLKPSPIDKIAHHHGAPWYWCSPETGGKCAECWRKHKPKECKGSARSTSSVRSKSSVGSTSSAKLGNAKMLKLLLLNVLSIIKNEESDEDIDMEE